MLTRCPRCETTFRVTPEQLKARHGRVRCGHCQNAFNALDTLIEAKPSPAQAPAPEALADEAPPPTVPAPPLAEPNPEPAPATVGELPVTPTPAVEPSGTEMRLPAGPAPSEEAPTGQAPAEAEEPEAAGPALEPLLHEAPKRRAWPWAFGSFAAVAALLLQAALHYRTEIAVLYPGAKPLLNAACVPFGCEVSLPRKPELVGIETSNLSPDSNDKLALSATLKNRAPFAQQFPGLELTLTDTGDQPLVRRVLAPADYLTSQALSAGFGAGSEIAVNLAIDAPGVPAAGYQIYLFYP